jgi:uncharacterized protein (DUF1684 family)
MTDNCYSEGIQNIRNARDERLKTNPQSWLSLIGLFRLESGDNLFGAEATNKIVLAKCGEAQCGSYHLENGSVRLLHEPNSSITVNNLPPELRKLLTDHDEETDLMRVGSLMMMVLVRGDDHYLRVWDKAAPAVSHFKGLKYFTINPAYRITAMFVAYEPPKPIKIQDVIGDDHDGFLAGEARFNLHGVDCCLVAEEDGDDLLFSFTDLTSKDTTYSGGRYLTADNPQDDRVILDFNKAVNWPCAYTSFATCPLPQAENRLTVHIEAGEMRYSDH